MESFRANIFDCLKQPDEGNSRFVNKHVRKLTEVENFKRLHSASPRIPAEGSSLRMFGCEWFDLGDKAMLEMSISARDILAKIMDEKWRRTASHFRYCLHIAEVILLLRMILGRTDSDGKELQAAISKLYNVLPEPVRAVMNTSRTSVDEMSVEMYDSFHGMLNFQWYGFLIVYEMEQRGKLGKPPEDYESIFRRLIEKLIRIAVFRYAHLSKSDLPSCGPFYCTCVRNFWFAVIIMAKSGTKQLDFWGCLHNALERVQKGADAETELPANDSLFIVWFIHGIASLRQYSHLDEQTFLETPVVETGNNFTLLDKAVKEFTEKDKPEEQLRVLLLLIRPIYCDWWRPLKHDFLFPLWEYFSKRLNSSFELPPNWLSKPAPPTINRSLTELLKQASYQASKKSYETMHYRTSSLSCFLRLLTFMIRHYSDKEQKQKVQILFNRTVLRLTPAKLALLTEQGIYNYALIMIAMVESTPYQNDHHRVSKQMLQFKLIQLGPTGNIDITIRRIITICMGNAALLVVLSRRQFDKTAYLKHLLDMIEAAWRKYGDRLQPALHVLAEAMDAVYNDVISTKRQLDKGDEKFIGGWLSRYLGGCSKSERVALYKTWPCAGRHSGVVDVVFFSRQFVVLHVSVFLRWAGLSVGGAGAVKERVACFVCVCLSACVACDCDVDV
ncbi:hypothetical protein RP20_CCG005777 [Aedes albopictus]|nr:hypothetical protein RP20_CCG005777 [Aedes albopictus]